jgi:hypothetical protein
MAIATALGCGDVASILVAVALAFFFGYSKSESPTPTGVRDYIRRADV